MISSTAQRKEAPPDQTKNKMKKKKEVAIPRNIYDFSMNPDTAALQLISIKKKLVTLKELLKDMAIKRAPYKTKSTSQVQVNKQKKRLEELLRQIRQHIRIQQQKREGYLQQPSASQEQLALTQQLPTQPNLPQYPLPQWKLSQEQQSQQPEEQQVRQRKQIIIQKIDMAEPEDVIQNEWQHKVLRLQNPGSQPNRIQSLPQMQQINPNGKKQIVFLTPNQTTQQQALQLQVRQPQHPIVFQQQQPLLSQNLILLAKTQPEQSGLQGQGQNVRLKEQEDIVVEETYDPLNPATQVNVILPSQGSNAADQPTECEYDHVQTR